MKKIIINEDTLEMTEVDVSTNKTDSKSDISLSVEDILSCSVPEFAKMYNKYKKAEAEFKGVYEPFKKKLLDLYKTLPDLPNNITVGGVKLTYVSPSIRNTIDSKKLKEEEPEIAKRFTKKTNVDATIRIN